ncbi:hypothetical protein K7X08_028795 [Anisodus acutangulus]|uniref:Uncharacterized protein n=1 Tax=Anisodus acutangulus TaxID=402998 RepID=A0A9Q1L1R5_9SOLA|nr:hypothetical protein K7X08_028795 [Anisodus acutangulus]
MITIRYIPGVQAIEPADLRSYCQDADPSTVMPRFVFKCIDDAQKADFVIHLQIVNALLSSDVHSSGKLAVFNHLGLTRTAAILCNWASLSHTLQQKNNFNEPAAGIRLHQLAQ